MVVCVWGGQGWHFPPHPPTLPTGLSQFFSPRIPVERRCPGAEQRRDAPRLPDPAATPRCPPGAARVLSPLQGSGQGLGLPFATSTRRLPLTAPARRFSFHAPAPYGAKPAVAPHTHRQQESSCFLLNRRDRDGFRTLPFLPSKGRPPALLSETPAPGVSLPPLGDLLGRGMEGGGGPCR